MFCFSWNLKSFLVDGIPIRVFKNNEANGVAYPKSQPMKIYSSLWEADDWATQGGKVKTDWTNAPFSASYRSFNDVDCCSRTSIWNWVTCNANSNSWMWTTLNSNQLGQLKWVQKDYMIYNYCTDFKRFPQGLPTECNLNWSYYRENSSTLIWFLSFFHFFVSYLLISSFCYFWVSKIYFPFWVIDYLFCHCQNLISLLMFFFSYIII